MIPLLLLGLLAVGAGMLYVRTHDLHSAAATEAQQAAASHLSAADTALTPAAAAAHVQAAAAMNVLAAQHVASAAETAKTSHDMAVVSAKHRLQEALMDETLAKDVSLGGSGVFGAIHVTSDAEIQTKIDDARVRQVAAQLDLGRLGVEPYATAWRIATGAH